LKLDHVRAAQPDIFVSGDMSCMMHMGGLAEKEGRPIKTRHIAQVLRDALKGGPGEAGSSE
jgi:L-lactate dehydrogenase complex protein LldE